MSTFHLSEQVRSTIASTGALGQSWLEDLAGSARDATIGAGPAGEVVEVEVVVAHQERVTLRVGDVFLKLDADSNRLDVEVEAMTTAPVPTPTILWRKPFELALAAVPGAPIARLGTPSTAPPTAWVAADTAVRALHDAPLPSWPGRTLDELVAQLDGECEWLLTNDVVPARVITRNRELADAALRPRTPAFIHGDLQVAHLFMEGDEVTGFIDWSEGAPWDPLYDLAILTLGHPEHLDDVLTGYGADVDTELIRGWWACRCLQAIRWLDEHGFGPIETMPEVAVLHTLA